MKFMMIMQCTQKAWEGLATWKPEEFRAHIQFMHDFNAQLRRSGEFVLAEGLDMPQNAKIVQAHDAKKPVVSDGPFAETKEFLAGWWIVDVASEDRAIALAAQASVSPGPGGKPLGIPIELRRVGEAPKV